MKQFSKFLFTACFAVLAIINVTVSAGTLADKLKGAISKQDVSFTYQRIDLQPLKLSKSFNDIRLVNITDLSENSIENATLQIESELKSFIDFAEYGLEFTKSTKLGKFVRINFAQKINNLQIESKGIFCIVNEQGKIVYTNIDLININSAKRPVVRNLSYNYEAAIADEFTGRDVSEIKFQKEVIKEVDGEIYFTNCYSLTAFNPLRGYEVYIDIESGNVVYVNDITDEVDGNIDGTFSGAWKTASPNDPLNYGAYASAYYDMSTWVEIPQGPPSTSSLVQKIEGPNYSEANGNFHYTSSLGITDYYFIYYMGNDIAKAAVGANSPFITPSVTSETFNVNTTTSFTLDFDWSQTDLVLQDPSLNRYLSGLYHLKAMHTWYKNWIGDDINYHTPISFFHDVDLGASMAGINYGDAIGISPNYPYDVKIICHEMAHNIRNHTSMDYSITSHFYSESQADYFTSSYLNVDLVFKDIYLYNYKKCQDNFIGASSHYTGAPHANSWKDMAQLLNPSYVDSLVFLIGYFNTLSHGNAVQALLMVDDDDGDLSNGTPNDEIITNSFKKYGLGPTARQIFYQDDQDICLYSFDRETNFQRYTCYTTINTSNTYRIMETYTWDSLVWNFGDGTSEVNTLEPQHAYTNCGEYDITCKAYYPWGVNIDTQHIIVQIGDYISVSENTGSDDYRFSVDLSLTNAVNIDSIRFSISYPGDVILTFDSLKVDGTRMDGWSATKILDNFNDDIFTYSLTPVTGFLTTGNGKLADIFFTAQTAINLNDFTNIELVQDSLMIYHGTSDCTPTSITNGKYTLTYLSGDLNGSGTVDNVDVSYMVDYSFNNGPAPVPYWSGDVDCSGTIDISDLTLLVNYIYYNGPKPCGNAFAGQYE